MYEEEEIYDDTTAEADMEEPTGLNALRSRFEQAQKQFESPAAPSLATKPVVTQKPKVLAKYGGGPGLNIATGNDPKANIPNSFKTTSAVAKETNQNETDKSEPQVQGTNQRRNSKLNIPAAFLEGSQTSPIENKPKPEIKPKWKADTNNNPKLNGIAPVEKIDKEALEKTLNPDRKPSLSENPNASKAKIPPREKSGDGPFANNQTSEAEKPKPNSPRGHGTASGAGRGINVLAMVSAMSGDAKSPGDLKSKLKHVDVAKKGVVSLTRGTDHSSAGTEEVPWRKSLRNAKLREHASLKRKSLVTVTRKVDGKAFQRITENSLKDESVPPVKPEKLDCEVDLEALEQEYKDTVAGLDNSGKTDHGWTEVEEEYDDCGNVMASTRAVSIIEPMTEDEEREWEEAGFPGIPESDELPPPPADFMEEDYDDVAVHANTAGTEAEENPTQDEMYEELPEEPPPTGPKPEPGAAETPPDIPKSQPKGLKTEQINGEIVNSSEKAKDSKEQEKERKKREKEEKKALEQKEKELKKLLKMFKTTSEVLASSVGKGKVKATNKGKKKEDVAVTEGDEVEILRMTDNPSGKWLVRVIHSQKVGYCDEKNIEVDTSSILNFMTGQKDTEPQVQEMYEDVEAGEDLEQDEIYEECN